MSKLEQWRLEKKMEQSERSNRTDQTPRDPAVDLEQIELQLQVPVVANQHADKLEFKSHNVAASPRLQ